MKIGTCPFCKKKPKILNVYPGMWLCQCADYTTNRHFSEKDALKEWEYKREQMKKYIDNFNAGGI